MTQNPGTPVPPELSSGVLAAVAAYAQALDANQPADVAALFVADGVSEIVGQAAFEGRAAIEAGYAHFPVAPAQLHLVTNVVISAWDDKSAQASSDLAFVAKGEAGIGVQMVGRYEDTLEFDAGTWRFRRRKLQFR